MLLDEGQPIWSSKLLNITLDLNSGILLEWSWWQKKRWVGSLGRGKKTSFWAVDEPDPS